MKGTREVRSIIIYYWSEPEWAGPLALCQAHSFAGLFLPDWLSVDILKQNKTKLRSVWGLCAPDSGQVTGNTAHRGPRAEVSYPWPDGGAVPVGPRMIRLGVWRCGGWFPFGPACRCSVIAFFIEISLDLMISMLKILLPRDPNVLVSRG